MTDRFRLEVHFCERGVAIHRREAGPHRFVASLLAMTACAQMPSFDRMCYPPDCGHSTEGGGVAKVLEVETSTRVLQVAEIKMFHAKAVAAWRGMVAAAQEKLGGVHSGLGFIGSPGWAITGSLVLGAIEGALSSASSKAGLKMLGEAGTFMAEIQERGVFIPVSRISGINTPRPDAWQATQEGIVFISLGEDFLQVRTVDQFDMMVRWSAISTFRPC